MNSHQNKKNKNINRDTSSQEDEFSTYLEDSLGDFPADDSLKLILAYFDKEDEIKKEKEKNENNILIKKLAILQKKHDRIINQYKYAIEILQKKRIKLLDEIKKIKICKNVTIHEMQKILEMPINTDVHEQIPVSAQIVDNKKVDDVDANTSLAKQNEMLKQKINESTIKKEHDSKIFLQTMAQLQDIIKELEVERNIEIEKLTSIQQTRYYQLQAITILQSTPKKILDGLIGYEMYPSTNSNNNEVKPLHSNKKRPTWLKQATKTASETMHASNNNQADKEPANKKHRFK